MLNLSESEKFNQYNAKAFDPYEQESDVEFAFEKENFEYWLTHSESRRGKKRSRQTVATTMERVQKYFTVFETLSQENVRQFRLACRESDLAPATANNRILAVANYIDFISQKYGIDISKWKAKQFEIAQKQFIEDVISRADYDFLVEQTIKDKKHPNRYLAIRIMGTTGLRLGELLQVKIEHIRHGYVDVIGKGGKQRRIYFPKKAREEMLEYLAELGASSGYVMRKWEKPDTETFGESTRDNESLSAHNSFKRRIEYEFDCMAKEYGISKELMHPHGFRHFFAKEFLKHRLDISLLADLLGHSSLEITRIYLKMTSREQADVVDDVVDW